MAIWVHPTQYRHYIKKYPQAGTTFQQIDLEQNFKCRYVSLENANNPTIKNIYTEDYAEHDGQRVYIDSNLAYNASELTLTLRWRQSECGDVLVWSDKFLNYITGQKFEYHDTFRPGKYWQLLFKDTPQVKAQRLFGDEQYIFLAYKLTNWGGKPLAKSAL